MRIDYNIIPEDVIRQFEQNRPHVISARIFESVTAELLVKQRELQLLLDEAAGRIADLEEEVSDNLDLDGLEDRCESLEKQLSDQEEGLIEFKKNFAQYLSDNTEIIEEMQGYFDENLEELIDEYRL